MRILIADGSPSSRAANIIEAFRGAGCDAHRAGRNPVQVTAVYDLILIHEGDDDLCDNCESIHRYHYSSTGFGAAETSKIVPRIGVNGISTADAKQLVVWIHAGCKSDAAPRLLGGADPLLDCRTALAFLAQASALGLNERVESAVRRANLPARISSGSKGFEHADAFLAALHKGEPSGAEAADDALAELCFAIDVQ